MHNSRYCIPPAGFSSCVKVEVNIRASVEEVFKKISDISEWHRFFPEYEFRADENRLYAGMIYSYKRRGSKKWTRVKVISYVENELIVGETLEPDSIFKRMQYEHRLVRINDRETISMEQVSYTPRYGILGTLLDKVIIKRLVMKSLLNAHLTLKKICEKNEHDGA